MAPNIDEPTSRNDHVYLGYTQRECKPNEAIIELYKKMLESRISAGTTENYRCGKNSRENCSVVLRHGRTCSEMRRVTL